MSFQTSSVAPASPTVVAYAATAVLLVAELAVLSVAYGLGFAFVCRDALPAAVCTVLSDAVPSVLIFSGLLIVMLAVRPGLRADLGAALRPRPHWGWACLHVAGVALILLPWAMPRMGAPLPPLGMMLSVWAAGLALAGAGFFGMLFQPAHLRQIALRHGAALAAIAVLAVAAPSAVRQLQALWLLDIVTNATFDSVLFVLGLLGEQTHSDPSRHLIEMENFWVRVGPQCSGVEGFGLITAFTLFYLWLFRDQLDLRRAWLLLPVGLVLSWVFNVLRIVALVQIGNHVSPQLALDGFHSHAGWVLFLLLSLGLALGAHQIAWFQRAGAGTGAEIGALGAEKTGNLAPLVTAPKKQVAFFEDRSVVLILPFVMFMASATLISSVTALPGLLYPLRMVLVLGVLWAGRAVLRGIDWRPDGLSMAAGVVCGVLWIVTAPGAAVGDAAMAARLETLPAAALAGWIAMRLLGTVVVVPLVEELFFRGYLLERLNLGGRFWQLVALAVSAVAFGVLHDRLIAGALAGVLFGLLYLRRGKLADAVWSHAAANAVIAAAALATANWSLI